GVTVLTFDAAGRFRERIEAKTAELDAGYWRLKDVVVYAIGVPPRPHGTYQLTTTLTPEQVRESFATPETVSFWNLRQYIEMAEQAGLTAAGYRLQYQLLLARPFLLAAMVILACSVSLRFFRFGGVTKMILSGVIAGFLLYVMSKVTEDVSKADLMHPAVAAWLPVLAGGLTGFVALLYLEDGGWPTSPPRVRFRAAGVGQSAPPRSLPHWRSRPACGSTPARPRRRPFWARRRGAAATPAARPPSCSAAGPTRTRRCSSPPTRSNTITP